MCSQNPWGQPSSQTPSPSPQMALYFCSGMLQDQTQFRHYALNVPLYTHFTSPIRRFADVLVHRLLAAALGKRHGREVTQPVPAGRLPRLRVDSGQPEATLHPVEAPGGGQLGRGRAWAQKPPTPVKAYRGSAAVELITSPVQSQGPSPWPPTFPSPGARQQGRPVPPRLGREQCATPHPAVAGAYTAPCQKPATALFPGCGELPDLEPETLQKQADHCNDRRMASKRVQELSTGLFFAVLVKVRPPAQCPPTPTPPSPPGHQCTRSS